MEAQKLYEAFGLLSQSSVHSVQSGKALSELDAYLHVERPVESRLLEKIIQIDEAGGGIILLVGSAGDGKSHLISKVKAVCEWGDECFYNDATASCSPKKTAIDTLKEALIDFKDANLHETSKKLVLAINLGKLNALIEDSVFKEEYKELINCSLPIFDNDDNTPPIETDRIKFILFTDEQIFEFNIQDKTDYPVSSLFLSSILKKITNQESRNPFYQAYLYDTSKGASHLDPLIINYELLSIPEVQHTICQTVIEAIVRFKLIITPREFLDFIYSIMVFVHYDEYSEKRDFFNALLPNMLYAGGDNTISRAIAALDPLKYSNTNHDRQLSVLFTSYSIPDSYFKDISYSRKLPDSLLNRINDFYGNNGRDIERTTKFVFRLKHILAYHSESDVYRSFLSLLRGIFNKDVIKMQEIYDVVSKAIPRHYGSFYEKSNMIPLNIQGGKYRLFAGIVLKPELINSSYDSKYPSKFNLRFDMSWKFSPKNVFLRLDYPLYNYLSELNQGRLALSYENEKDLSFSRFIRELISKCNCEQDLTIVRYDTTEMELVETAFGNIQLQ